MNRYLHEIMFDVRIKNYQLYIHFEINAKKGRFLEKLLLSIHSLKNLCGQIVKYKILS